ncbi:MAG: hypothetical protein Ct9H300mP16_11160 [Pseudomonadota bacterium]|nr:MAG: hypothetical protein Ct9H300mP16_11160 [Pseudomonadota bacterium]
MYPLKCMLSPEIPSNAGCYRPLHVKAPAGSVFNCDKPVAVNMRTRTGWYLAPNLYKTIADAAPDRVQAFTGLPGSALFYGYESGGRIYNDHLFQGGGQGGLTTEMASRGCFSPPALETPRLSCSRPGPRFWCWRKVTALTARVPAPARWSWPDCSRTETVRGWSPLPGRALPDRCRGFD